MRENFLSVLSSETYILIFSYVNLFQTSICPFCPLEQSYHFHFRKCLSKGGIPWNWGKSWKLWRMVSPDVRGVTDLYHQERVVGANTCGKESCPRGKLVTYAVDWPILAPSWCWSWSWSCFTEPFIPYTYLQTLQLTDQPHSCSGSVQVSSFKVSVRVKVIGREHKGKESSRTFKTSEKEPGFMTLDPSSAINSIVTLTNNTNTKLPSFLIFNMGTIVVIFHRIILRIQWVNIHKRHKSVSV